MRIHFGVSFVACFVVLASQILPAYAEDTQISDEIEWLDLDNMDIDVDGSVIEENAKKRRENQTKDSEIAQNMGVFQDAPLVIDTVNIQSQYAREIYYQSSPFVQTVSTDSMASINDWIEQAPGVYGDSTGKGQRLVYVRGFSTRQITARFDNMPIDTGYDGITGFDAIPMNWIGKGEIKHADAHSDDAIGLGGSVLMQSVMPAIMEAAFDASLTGARFSVAHGKTLGPWAWAVTAGGNYSNGFRLSHAFNPTPQEDGGMRDASKSYGYNAFAKIARDFGAQHKLEISGGYTQAPRDVPTGIGTGYYRYWKFTEYHIGLVNAKWAFHTPILHGFWQAWFNDQGNRLEVFDDPKRTIQESVAANNSDWIDRDAGTILFLSSQPVSIGLGYMDFFLRSEFRYQYHHSLEYTMATDSTVEKSSDRFTFDIRPGFNWQILPSLFFNASGYAVGDIEISHEDSSKDIADLVNLYNGGFSAGLDFIPENDYKISFRAARRLRMPSLKEQFSRADSTGFALNAEVAWNFQIQIDYTPLETLKFQLSGFDSEVSDLINYRYINGIKEAYNVDEARIAGVDFSTHIGPFYRLSLDFAYSFLHSRDLKQKITLTDRPEHHVRVALTYTPIEEIAISLRAQYESKRRTEAWLSSKSAWLGDIFTLDAQIDYKTPYFTAYIRGTNLLDYDYARSFGYPEPGFQLFFGGKIALH